MNYSIIYSTTAIIDTPLLYFPNSNSRYTIIISLHYLLFVIILNKLTYYYNCLITTGTAINL